MAKTIKEERLRWVLPIVSKEIKLSLDTRVCPYGKRSLERWVAAYRLACEAALEPKTKQVELSSLGYLWKGANYIQFINHYLILIYKLKETSREEKSLLVASWGFEPQFSP